MNTIFEVLKPRENVFSDTAREDVLNLSDFAEHRIDANKFFGENFRTQGMTVYLIQPSLASRESQTPVL